ncbi:DUF5343 domain-containing protein [Pseudomonas sp. 6D_7.1_Bac1]|uniref:DUF5343 domain-containing protein n=1 Tax=Pseudomonas sp. 6D_7.1_Bac1 TaxID=2971615 RepID=UPI0021C7C252|nr:DUF5343 domain-containing protein [Pseudomonas sp. 6D_7.1_Bac1]MCU1750085.1 DUF5343 domain-containing protein [Pseudomonas sp. 6D_7.1_Bac1]
MADKHPYTSGATGLTQTINQLRRAFPAQLTADTLKKLGIAPNNESYVLNTLRFISVLDADNKKNSVAVGVFNQHEDPDFQAGLSGLVKPAYDALFDLHGDDAWKLPTNRLIAFFRNHDHTSDIVGKRQASTFQALAVLCGQTEESVRSPSSKVKKADSTPRPPRAKPATQIKASESAVSLDAERAAMVPKADAVAAQGNGMALTVRVEINLPAGGDQETYDRIFKSIRENLLNGSNS